MTKEQKTEYIDKLVTIAYFWLSEENYGCSYSIYNLLKKLELNKKEEKRVEGLKTDTITMGKEKFKINEVKEIIIPSPCNTDEKKLLWITLTTLMNLFNSGNFEMGYMFLMEFAETWNDVYINIIPLIKCSEFKNEIIDWAATHFFFAKDILGKESFELYGYKIEKLNRGV